MLITVTNCVKQSKHTEMTFNNTNVHKLHTLDFDMGLI